MESNIFLKKPKKVIRKTLCSLAICFLALEGNYRILNPSFNNYSLNSNEYLIVDQRGLAYSFLNSGYDCYVHKDFLINNHFETDSLKNQNRYMFNYYFGRRFGKNSNLTYLKLSKNSCEKLIEDDEKIKIDLPINL